MAIKYVGVGALHARPTQIQTTITMLPMGNKQNPLSVSKQIHTKNKMADQTLDSRQPTPINKKKWPHFATIFIE